MSERDHLCSEPRDCPICVRSTPGLPDPISPNRVDVLAGTRLRIVCDLVGVSVNGMSDEDIANCAFTLLGSVRMRLERANQALHHSVGLSIKSLAK